MNPRTRRAFSLAMFGILLLTCYPASAQRGARTISRGLDQLSQEAQDIVRASVLSARVEPHPQLQNLMTVVVTLDVHDTIKGTPRKTLEFRQYIWDIRDQLDGASYQKGQELLLMLGPVSRYGLRSPVGLEQGRFRIMRDSSGKVTAVNGHGNLGLFESTAARVQQTGIVLSPRTASLVKQPPRGPIALADLEEAIRNFSKGGAQ